MNRNSESYLRLHSVDAESDCFATGHIAGVDLAALLNSFTRVSGWTPVPVSTTERSHLGYPRTGDTALRERVKLVPSDPMDGNLDGTVTAPVVSEEAAWELLEQIDALVRQLEQMEQLVERQESQLATAIGVSVSTDEPQHLAERLKETLKSVALQTGSDAAAIYLLDETTSELNMRCVWGMPASKLAEPARPLRGAVADLEALLGNAVLIENTRLAPEWNCPEDFAAGMCLPIGSPTMPQGTLWLWSNHVRDFSTLDIEFAKMAADKMLVEIERCILAEEAIKAKATVRDADRASLVQSAYLPDNQPLHEDYEISGWTFQGHSVGGNFHDWALTPSGLIVGAIGDAEESGTPGALVATSVQSVLQTFRTQVHRPSQALCKANDLLWEAADENNMRCSLAYFQLYPPSGALQIAVAGTIRAFLLSKLGYRRLGGVPTLLGEQPDARFQCRQEALDEGDLLILATADVFGSDNAGGLSEQELLEVIMQNREESVEAICNHLARKMPIPGADKKEAADRSLLIVRRKAHAT